jgi:hypothetical protein
MSVIFPSSEFFQALQKAVDADPGCTGHLDPCEAYCGFSIDDRLYVFEFDGRTCLGAMSGGNELDLDFVVAGSNAAWREALDAIAEGDDAGATLPALADRGALEIRAQDEEGLALGKASLPFLQVFLEQARGVGVTFE